MEDLQNALNGGDYDQVADAFKTKRLTSRSAVPLLHHAIAKSLPQAVAFLLQQGVRPVVFQISPLAKCRSIEIFELLEQAGWPIKTKGHLILTQALDSREVVDWLLDQGAQLNFPQSELRTDLKKGEQDDTLAVLNEAAAQGNIDMFDYLVSRGADPQKCLALHYATFYKPQDPAQVEFNIAHLLQRYDYDVNGDDTCGGLVKLSDFTYTGREGPPLRWAVYHDNLPAVESLLRHGAEPSAALLVAVERDNLEALKLLLGAGGNATEACRIAATRSKIDAALMCLEHGADPNPSLVRDAELAGAESMYKPMNGAMKALLNDPKYKSDSQTGAL
ncbi:ankyrin repeat-containing domain protein [Annulohypoxylon truncatum]|uniref:ankyrin repeat-containing domain protein n=1 Tax=Annulohypoxylon truncatum TaxID=327061 RepID=UPI002008B1FF|nr:ankyrin repeat-containing domain protein [Annulohypoxylon truncatum]KAI1211529.1 ankyrin repeat-containing domain protein [Annulohypoxylon truncatum]